MQSFLKYLLGRYLTHIERLYNGKEYYIQAFWERLYNGKEYYIQAFWEKSHKVQLKR